MEKFRVDIQEHASPFNPVLSHPAVQVAPESLGEFRLFSIQFNNPRNRLEAIKSCMQGCFADTFGSGFPPQIFQPAGEVLAADSRTAKGENSY